MSGTTTGGHKVGPEDFGTGQSGTASRWHAEVKLAQKSAERWLKDCTRIERRYRNERRGADAVPLARFNVHDHATLRVTAPRCPAAFSS
jgi:hypothetical protein